ncbi:hypothetical protein [Nocardia sienata]|uniref:hypothetical protein n=1 Tax=Nocardia sienata TaxID=248552 RepID=UPI0007A4F656|nr:hypothetical protein [Nocardia sienata]
MKVSTNQKAIRALTAAAITVAGLGVIAVDPGPAAATGAGGGSCLADQVFDHGDGPNGYEVYACVTATQEECTAWTARTAAAVGGRVVADTCGYVREGLGGWAHPAGFYGAVTRSV